jgi:hypothetical protein
MFSINFKNKFKFLDSFLIFLALVNLSLLNVSGRSNKDDSSGRRQDYSQVLGAGGVVAAALLAMWVGDKLINNYFSEGKSKKEDNKKKYKSNGFNVITKANGNKNAMGEEFQRQSSDNIGLNIISQSNMKEKCSYPDTCKEVFLNKGEYLWCQVDNNLLDTGPENAMSKLKELVQENSSFILPITESYGLDEYNKMWVSGLPRVLITKESLLQQLEDVAKRVSIRYLNNSSKYKESKFKGSGKKVFVYELFMIYAKLEEFVFKGIEIRIDEKDSDGNKGFVLLAPKYLFNEYFDDDVSGGYILKRLFTIEGLKGVITKKRNEALYNLIEGKLGISKKPKIKKITN